MIKLISDFGLRIAFVLFLLLDLILTGMVLFPQSLGLQMAVIILWGFSITVSVTLAAFILIKDTEEREERWV
jgi:predicted MFS family arabinose efflux permease